MNLKNYNHGNNINQNSKIFYKILITLAAIVSHITTAINAMNGPNPDNFSPGIILFLDGNPKKYLIGPGDLAMRKATKHVTRVDNIIVTKNDASDGIRSVPFRLIIHN